MIVALLIGYLIGSFPSAVLVGKIRGVDPRERGDGDPGWWNARVLFGERIALVVLAADLIKGAAATAAATHLWGPWWTPFVALGGALLGHSFPLFGDLRGGRGVPTFFGGIAVLAPVAAGASLVVGVVVALAARHLVHGARVTILLVPVGLVLLGALDEAVAASMLLGFVGLRFLLQVGPGWTATSR